MLLVKLEVRFGLLLPVFRAKLLLIPCPDSSCVRLRIPLRPHRVWCAPTSPHPPTCLLFLQYRNTFHALISVGKEEGISALYKGLKPALLRQATYGGLRVGFYEVRHDEHQQSHLCSWRLLV